MIDEAGQAMPQSAPGAIWRSQRCIVVGDPLQIEPVVTIHDKTIQYLKEYFEQSDFIASKDTSVQSLADASNCYGGYRYYGEKKMWIGSPLLVHGRCQKAIFDISNSIAYNNKMIYASYDQPETACEWIHVEGKAVNQHFVRNQADVILPMVIEAFKNSWKAGKDVPSLFIITPFRSVKAGLIRYFADQDALCEKLRAKEKEQRKKVRQWIFNNLGTIHTFQGKEADMVILCLGVDSSDRGNGAIGWASEKPNILNVAVTRAKNRLYIVGDAKRWSGRPFFKTAYEICTKRSPAL